MLTSSSELRRCLAEADGCYNRQRATAFLLRTVKLLAVLVVALIVGDVVFHLGPGGRLGLVGAWFVLVLILLGRAFYRAFVYRHPDAQVARMLEERDASLGSALINTLQLDAQTRDPDKSEVTRMLARQAVDDSLARIDRERLRESMKLAEVGRAWKQALWSVALLAVAMLAAWPIMKVELPRFLDPFGDHPPYSFTTLAINEPADDTFRVTYGEPLLVRATASGHVPNELFLSFYDPAAPQSVTTVPMFTSGKDGFVQSIESVKSDLVMAVHVENKRAVSKQRSVSVILTPNATAAYATIAPPDYTGIVGKEKKFLFGNVKALVGSKVHFRIQSNRPLAGGRLDFEGSDGWREGAQMRTTGENEVAGEIVAEQSGKVRFTLVDVDGIESNAVLGGSITTFRDQPPTISIPVPGNNAFVTQDFTLEARFDAADDYGIRELRIHRALNGVYSVPKVIRFDDVTPRHTEIMPIPIGELGVVPGDVITLSADVTDTCPDPQSAVCDPVNLIVVSVEEYNNFLRERTEIGQLEEKYQDLINRYRELLDEQAELQKQAEKLQKDIQEGKAGSPEEIQRKMDELIAKQQELDAKLNKMADEMENFVRDNPLYDVEKEFDELLKELAQEIRESTKKSERELEQFSKESEDSAKKSKGQQLEALRGLSDSMLAQMQRLQPQADKMEDEITETLVDLDKLNQLIKDLNRFRDLYELQAAIAERSKIYNTIRRLGDADKLALKKLASEERLVSQELEQIAKDLLVHADAAEELFPKAAESARAFAEALKKARLDRLAAQAANAMLAPDGPASYELAERLRRDMLDFFNESDDGSGNCKKCVGSELDAYLRLLRGLKPGETGKQMMCVRPGFRFGSGNTPGFGPAGPGGQGGTSAQNRPAMNVLGNETMLGNRNSNDPTQAGRGQNPGGSSRSASDAFDAVDVLDNVQHQTQNSDSVNTESALQEYGDVIDKYIETITE